MGRRCLLQNNTVQYVHASIFYVIRKCIDILHPRHALLYKMHLLVHSMGIYVYGRSQVLQGRKTYGHLHQFIRFSENAFLKHLSSIRHCSSQLKIRFDILFYYFPPNEVICDSQDQSHYLLDWKAFHRSISTLLFSLIRLGFTKASSLRHRRKKGIGGGCGSFFDRDTWVSNLLCS